MSILDTLGAEDLLPIGTTTPTTNLLAMPFIAATFVVANNEDWVDSIVYLLNSTDPAAPQLDIRGIDFSMEVRRDTHDHEVVIRASTDDETLVIGEPPNYGYILINIPHETMKNLAEADYVGDILGKDDFSTRRCISIILRVVEGVTRP